jgi:hypothetical protein
VSRESPVVRRRSMGCASVLAWWMGSIRLLGLRVASRPSTRSEALMHCRRFDCARHAVAAEGYTRLTFPAASASSGRAVRLTRTTMKVPGRTDNQEVHLPTEVTR